MSVVTPTMSSTIQRQSWGAQTVVFGTMAFDNSGYDAAGGGDVITPSKFGLMSIDQMIIEPTAGYMLNYIESTGRVKVYLSAGGSGTTGATSGGTPAGTIVVTGVNASAGTPAGTNAASDVTAAMLPDYSAVVKPAIKLTYNADPPGGLAANALYVVEALAGASLNCGTLQSNCAATTDVLGETADGSVFGAAGSARFWVTHNATPAGVQIYVNEATSYQLECISPTGEDVIVLMPMENAAGIGSAYVKVLIHHSATADTGKALYFDDNGAADGQLCFVATDTADHAIPPTDITAAIGGATVGSDGGFGSAAAQTFTGAAMGNHLHNDTAAFTGAGLATHTHTTAGGTAGEVPNGTNISALTGVTFIAIGR